MAAAKQAALASEHEEKIREVRAREEKLDVRSNTAARRELRKDLKKIINERSQKFEVTKATKARRWLVFVVYMALLAYFGAGIFVCTDLSPQGFDSANEPPVTAAPELPNWPNIIRQSAFGIAFAVTAGFFLRWLNRWAQVHADEEFRIKRLELDVDRASWLVEMIYEWKDDKGTAMPTELVKMLGANLFADQSTSDHAMTAADALGSALLNNAAQAKLKYGGNEISFNRRGIKSLSKTPIDNDTEEST